MRELASRLMDEMSVRQGDDPVAAVVLLYERLRPVIGPGGFGALMRRATASLSQEHPALKGVTDTASIEAALTELRTGLSQGSEDPGAVVADLVDELLGTLERMIGPELTERLVQAKNLTRAGRHE